MQKWSSINDVMRLQTLSSYRHVFYDEDFNVVVIQLLNPPLKCCDVICVPPQCDKDTMRLSYVVAYNKKIHYNLQIILQVVSNIDCKFMETCFTHNIDYNISYRLRLADKYHFPANISSLLDFCSKSDCRTSIKLISSILNQIPDLFCIILLTRKVLFLMQR